MPIRVEFVNNKKFLVRLITSFRNKEWADEFGRVQEALKARQYDGVRFNEAEIDMSSCGWVDPLPLLSLLISLTDFKANSGKTVLYLPSIDENQEKQSDKVLKFLAEEGFLEEFAKCCRITDGITTITDNENNKTQYFEDYLKSYKRVRTTVFYTNCTLIPALLIDARKEFNSEPSNVDTWVESKVRHIRSKISDKAPSYSQSTLLHRITNILVETIQNIVKHAYKENDHAYAGIYLRFRNGKENKSLSIEELTNIEKGLQQEEKHCPKLSREFLDLRNGCIEIFVIDSGVGFTESLRSNLNNHDAKYPFRQSFTDVFIQGNRRKYEEIPDRTEKGGLYLIGEMLKANQDYICGKDENEWVGSLFPFENPKGSFELAKRNTLKVNGLSWIFRLSWRSETEINSKDWTSWIGTAKHHPGYQELYRSSFTGSVPGYPFLDNRFEANNAISLLPGEENARVFFFLPSPNQTKYKLWDSITNICKILPLSDDRTLIIADIPEFEKRTYTYILDNIQFAEKDTERRWYEKISKIILISCRLCVSVLERNGKTFTVANDTQRERYFENLDKGELHPENSIRCFFAWIKAHDSKLFWAHVKQYNKQKQFFINNSVAWNKELETIDTYLNFAQTVADSFCLSIYRKNIERSIGFFDFQNSKSLKNCIIKPLDPLTKRLIDEYNATFFNDIDKENENIVYLGSVFASGSSLDDALFYSDSEKNSPTVLPIYFFKNSDSKTNIQYLLNWPDPDWLETNKKQFPRTKYKLQRVGSTHVIAKHGYKSYPIPRYDLESKKSVYARTPSATYRDWQDTEQRLITFGHFEFEGKHDLLKLNLVKKVTESFENNDSFAQFLVAEFFNLLGGVSKTELTPAGEAFWPAIENRLKESNNDEVALIAYPNNVNASFVVDKIKGYISPKLTEKIFSLMPINKERVGASLLVSPLVFDPIIQLLDQYPKGERKVVLFDSTIITGRTRKELKHLLFSLGADEVKTFTLTDRFRLPFKVPDKSKHTAYWRLDVPRLGSIESCSFCKALQEAKNLKNEIVSQFAQERIDQWLSGWDVISYYNPITNGITPTAIEPVIKKFGIEFDELTNDYVQIISEEDKQKGVDNRITLTNSTGVTIYATELHSVTSKDDIALSLCRKEPILPAKAVIELLSSQFLLFPTEHSSHNLFAMAVELFEACNSRDFTDNHSALAAIVLISQGKKMHIKLMERLLTKDFKFNNIDIDLIIAYILRHSIDEQNNITDRVNSLLKFKDDYSTLSKFEQLHSELYNAYGKIHTRPLVNFYVKKMEVDSAVRVRHLNYSLSKVIYLINQIREYRKWSESNSFDEKLKDECLIVLQDAQKDCIYVLNKKDPASLSEGNTEYANSLKALEKKIEETVVPKLKVLHKFLFCNVVYESDEKRQRHPIKNELYLLVKRITSNTWIEEAKLKNKVRFLKESPEVKISGTESTFSDILSLNRTNAWMILDDFIYDEIIYCVMNAVHAIHPISNIWSFDAKNDQLADMWIYVDYERDHVLIKFLNSSEKQADEIKETIERKKKRGLIHLKEDLKGDWTVTKINEPGYDNLILIQLKIPII
ncbi:hypothetical protein GWC95_15585 [Sediminibacterium roseum]|uniref:Histidine kinase-, DNA gyrase B-, and HSP90-like ATPase n=1 Tax=Sediminibacterium roseum TaxID=1978412 RepID=A0ABX0A2B6_9BACT|nr:hypothetical protein [Sediminibacterium roseum]NCI51350.1 hypothetical protein [Sediminibacterium roseum]